MMVTITNLFDNEALKEPKKFKKGHGNAFLININGKKWLFDTGENGKKFLDNLALVDVAPDDITGVILSHGHFDHTTGLVSLVSARSGTNVLDITAHPAVREKKGSGNPGGTASIADIGFPATDGEFENKTLFTFLKDFTEIQPGMYFTGEINDRPERDGTDTMLHVVNGEWVHDSVLDDTSLVFDARDGLVLLAGCCHAGLLNTLLKVREELGGKKVAMIIGGTHMMGFNHAEVQHVADTLENKHGSPELFLNHCTGARAIEQLQERFQGKVKPFPAGASISFELQ